MSSALRAAALALLVAAAPAVAQQAQPANGVLLVARPGMQDERFARSVVLVTQLEDGQTLGVILNKPTPARHESKPLWFGGPVLPRSVVGLFAAAQRTEVGEEGKARVVFTVARPVGDLEFDRRIRVRRTL